MFLGTFTRAVDDKWRLPLPSEILSPGSAASGNFYFVMGKHALLLFTEETYQDTALKLMDPTLKNLPAARTFFGSTYLKQRDKTGRLQVPEALRVRSGLSTGEPVVLIGAGNCAELYPKDRAPEEPSGEDMMDAFAALGERS